MEVAYPIYTRHLFILPSISFEYFGQNITDYYFGIDTSEASVNRPEYSPGSAWGSGFRVYMERPINDHWSVISMLRYIHVSNEISNSPIVNSRSESYSAHLGVLWSF